MVLRTRRIRVVLSCQLPPQRAERKAEKNCTAIARRGKKILNNCVSGQYPASKPEDGWNLNWNLLTDPTHCDPLYHEPRIFWPSLGAIFQSKNKSHAIWYRTTSVFNCLWGVLKNWTTWSATRLSASIHVKHEVSIRTSEILQIEIPKISFYK